MARPAELPVGIRAAARDTGKASAEAIRHHPPLPSAEVDVDLKISIRIPGGVGERGVRVVSESANAFGLAASNVEKE